MGIAKGRSKIGFGLQHIKKKEKNFQKLGFNSAEDYVRSF